MYRSKFAQHVPGKDSNQRRERTSRASGEMFIASNDLLKTRPSEARCESSRFARRRINRTNSTDYKYFAPTALRTLIMAVLLVASLSILSGRANAQRRAVQSAPSIPSPRAAFGFNPGDDRTIADWKQITDYFVRLDKASDRVQVQTIGTSTLGRTMIAAFISAPENIRNLDKYKAIQSRLADPRKVACDAERDQLIRDGKTVVVISCSIQSTEIVASQMAGQLAYNLTTGNDADTLSILHNTILILVPSPNPDGVDIVANWYRKTLGTPNEGREPPELYHYYAGHDDNRDWFMLDLKETRNITRLFWKEWFPEIVYDINQQGSNGSRFFVPPFYDPAHPRDIMQMELIACHSMLSLASNYRADYLRNFYELGKANVSSSSSAEPIAYLIPAGQGRDENVAKMIGTLVEQGVEVYRLDHELHGITGAQNLLTSTNERGAKVKQIVVALSRSPGNGEIPAGSYIVFLNQPYRQNVLALFEPQVYPDRTTATGEAERPYDVAGWTLPMQMGVDAPAVMSISESATERKLTLIQSENDVRRDLALQLGTSDSSPIPNPIKAGVRIGIYQNSRAGNMDEGWTRYVFDTFNVPYKSFHEDSVNDANPRATFDAIVLPSEQTRANPDNEAPAETARGITDKGYTNLSKFVEDGGTLICFDGSCAAVIRQMKLPLRNVLAGVRSSAFYCPGSILRLNVDTSSPIARTMPKDTDAYFISSSAFDATDNKVHVIARYGKDDVLRSGWLRGEDKIKDKIALAEVTAGKGRVVLFAFRPQHRGQTWGTFSFICTAINLAAGQ